MKNSSPYRTRHSASVFGEAARMAQQEGADQLAKTYDKLSRRITAYLDNQDAKERGAVTPELSWQDIPTNLEDVSEPAIGPAGP